LKNIYFIYSCCNGNARDAARLYAERYPNRHKPDHWIFTRTHQRLRDGIFFKMECKRVVSVDMDEDILAMVENNSESSTRSIGRKLGVSHQKVHKALKRDGQHPYHLTIVQNLRPGDQDKRLQFCREMLRKRSIFLSRILWTDES